jgi:endonuclease YncB( thermonuclease family)
MSDIRAWLEVRDLGTFAEAFEAEQITPDDLRHLTEDDYKELRLHGIDAPESKQVCVSGGAKYRCGQKAALALSDRIGRGSVTCEAKDTDRYSRVIAVCFKGQEDLNGWLVSEGLAVAYRRYSQDYVGQENNAKAASIGLWSGEYVMPWAWRRGKRLAFEQVSTISSDCVIRQR